MIFGLTTELTRGALVTFLEKIRQRVATGGRSVRIDFRQTRLMTPAGTLLFAAELDRINVLLGTKPVRCGFYPRDHVVAQVLKHVGIFEMLGLRGGPTHITAETVKYWKVDSGDMADGRRADDAMAGYKDRFTDPEQKALYRGLTEAMTNCRHHAYVEQRGDGLDHVKRWWMFSQLHRESLFVAICDLGMGIPRSLKSDRAGLLAAVMSALQMLGLRESDGNLIRAAMEVGRTRTKQEERGKGLMDMRSVLDALGGRMQIHSDGGFFEFVAESGAKKASETCKDLISIRGTLVLWEVPVPSRPKAS